MTDTIAPALTPSEWKDARWQRGDREFSCRNGMWLAGFDEGIGLLDEEMPVVIALANHALPSDSPYKITREDVEALRAGRIACAGERDAARRDGRSDDARSWQAAAHTLDALMDKLAAFLPPA